MEDGSIVPRTAGTPQGGVISSTSGEFVPALCVRHVDGANLSAHPVRALRGRRHLSLQKRRGGAGIMERACRPFCGLQADAASREDEDRLLQGCEPARRFPEPSFDFLGFTFRARKTMWQGHISAHGFMPAASPKALKPISRKIRRWALHHRSDKSLQDLAAMYNPCIRGWINYYGQLLPDAVASDPDEDRCLCHSLGAPQIQAASPSDQRRQRLVCPASPRQSNALRPLAAMSWQRPNIGSRVNREVHARFWERPEVKFLRATRHCDWV